VFLLLLATVSGQTEDCNDLAASISQSDDHERVSPDYVAGPWFLMPEEFPFASWTKRPRIVKVMQLLGSVAKTVDEIDVVAESARKEKQPAELAMISEGEAMVDSLKKQLDDILIEERSLKNFGPTQSRITNIINQILVPKLEYLSKLEQTSADIRFPFAERLAAYTSDMMGLLRAKSEAQECITTQAGSKATDNYDKLGQDMKKKIDDEISAASKLLNGNSKSIDDTTNYIKSIEAQITGLRANLSVLLEVGGKFTQHHKDVAEITLDDQQSLIHGIEAAQLAQDDMIATVKGEKDSVIATLHHIASLMMGLVEQNEPQFESALLPPLAQQTVKEDC